MANSTLSHSGQYPRGWVRVYRNVRHKMRRCRFVTVAPPYLPTNPPSHTSVATDTPAPARCKISIGTKIVSSLHPKQFHLCVNPCYFRERLTARGALGIKQLNVPRYTRVRMDGAARPTPAAALPAIIPACTWTCMVHSAALHACPVIQVVSDQVGVDDVGCHGISAASVIRRFTGVIPEPPAAQSSAPAWGQVTS